MNLGEYISEAKALSNSALYLSDRVADEFEGGSYGPPAEPEDVPPARLLDEARKKIDEAIEHLEAVREPGLQVSHEDEMELLRSLFGKDRP